MASRIALCILCGGPVTGHQQVEFQVVGFERPRAQGGTNALRLRRRTGNVAHRDCVDKEARGLTGQEPLFPSDDPDRV